MRQEKDGDSLISIMCRNIIELRTIQTLFYKIQAKQVIIKIKNININNT